MQVVSQQSSMLAPIAVEAALKVINPEKDTNIDLKVSLQRYETLMIEFYRMFVISRNVKNFLGY